MNWLKKAWNWGKEKVSNGYKKLKSFFGSNDNPSITRGNDEAEKERQRQYEIERQRELDRQRRDEEWRREQERLDRERREWDEEQRRRMEEQRREEEKWRRQQEKLRREKEEKARIKRRAAMIDEYQDKVAVKAEAYETEVRKQDNQTYSKIIEDLEQQMDVGSIRKMIEAKSRSFENKMRDEVNAKINLGNYELVNMMDDYSLEFEEYCNKVDAYTEKVYESAKKHLLESLNTIIEETNSFITIHAKKSLQDTLDQEKEHRDNLANLSKEGEVRDAQLLKSSSEYATLLFIQEQANKKVE